MAGGSSPREWLCFALDLVQAPCPLLQPWDPHPNYASPSHRAPRASVRTPGRQGHLSPEAELASLQDSQRGCRWGAVLMTLGQKQQVPGGGLQLSDLPVQRQHQLPGGVLRTLGNGARRHPPRLSQSLLGGAHSPAPLAAGVCHRVRVRLQGAQQGDWAAQVAETKAFKQNFLFFYYLAAAHRIYIVVHGLSRSLRA